MRVAVIESAPRGGLLHYAAQLSGGLARRGDEVVLITARGQELESAPPGIELREALPAAARDPGEPPTGVRLLVRRAGIALRVVAASAKTIREVVRGRFDAAILVDDLSVAPAAAGALALTFVPGRPLLAAICHEPRPRSRRGDGLYERSTLLHALLRRVYRRLDVVFVHGERSRLAFARQWPPATAEVIPHGNEELLAASVPSPSPEERILFFGEWRRAKGLNELLAAFDLLVERRPAARLTIAGVPTPDADPERVRAWARAHGSRVTVIDRYVGNSELPDLFASARVVATPYIAGSQSGVVHLAMTMARAVVATDVGELADTVVDGETGVLVPAGEVAPLADALAAVVGDPERVARLGAAGRDRALTEFSWDSVAERVQAALAAR
jgi:glycosyltransferase involved in cell wall biosynthesis